MLPPSLTCSALELKITLANSLMYYLSSAENRVKENPLRSSESCWGRRGEDRGECGQGGRKDSRKCLRGLRQDGEERVKPVKLCSGKIIAEERTGLLERGATNPPWGPTLTAILWHRPSHFGLAAQRGSSSDLNIASRSFSLPDKAGRC